MVELNTYSISVFMVPITNCHYHVGGWHDTWRKPFFDNKWPINTIGTLRPDMGMIPKGSFWQGLNLGNIFQIHKSQDKTGLQRFINIASQVRKNTYVFMCLMADVSGRLQQQHIISKISSYNLNDYLVQLLNNLEVFPQTTTVTESNSKINEVIIQSS